MGYFIYYSYPEKINSEGEGYGEKEKRKSRYV